jgi:hypothetical protein
LPGEIGGIDQVAAEHFHQIGLGHATDPLHIGARIEARFLQG